MTNDEVRMNTLRNLHKYLKAVSGLGTFLKFEISMDGTARATYTHGRIDFENMEDLARWLEEAASGMETINEQVRDAKAKMDVDRMQENHHAIINRDGRILVQTRHGAYTYDTIEDFARANVAPQPPTTQPAPAHEHQP